MYFVFNCDAMALLFSLPINNQYKDWFDSVSFSVPILKIIVFNMVYCSTDIVNGFSHCVDGKLTGHILMVQ